jgi:hypothetical protein
VPLAGSTSILLEGIVQNLGDAFSHSPGMILSTVALALFVGLFLARNWHQRLTRAISFPGQRQTGSFVSTVTLPALQGVYETLHPQGAEVALPEAVVEDLPIPRLDLLVTMGDERGFTNEIHPVNSTSPPMATP